MTQFEVKLLIEKEIIFLIIYLKIF